MYYLDTISAAFAVHHSASYLDTATAHYDATAASAHQYVVAHLDATAHQHYLVSASTYVIPVVYYLSQLSCKYRSIR